MTGLLAGVAFWLSLIIIVRVLAWSMVFVLELWEDAWTR